MMPNQPQLEFLCTMSAMLQPPLTIGRNPHGDRYLLLANEGTFEGPHFNGKLLSGSGDWLLVRPDGVAELDVRATLQTDDDALVYTQCRGYLTNIREIAAQWRAGEQVPPEAYYCAVTASFETGASQYAWLHQAIVIGSVELTPGGLAYHFFTVK